MGFFDSILSGKKDPFQQENVNEMALAKLEEKYGIVFTYKAPAGNSMTGTRIFIASTKKMPDARIGVKIENYREEQRVFTDNYLAWKYRDDVEALFEQNLSGLFTDFRVYESIPETETQSEGLKADASLEEYLADQNGTLIVTVEIKNSEEVTREKLESFLIGLQPLLGCAHVAVIVTDDATFQKHLSENELKGLVPYNKFVVCVSETIQNGSIDITWWGE